MTFPERVAAAEAKLRAGYNPEQENEAPQRSDAWGRALGWQDAIREELLDMEMPSLRTARGPAGTRASNGKEAN